MCSKGCFYIEGHTHCISHITYIWFSVALLLKGISSLSDITLHLLNPHKLTIQVLDIFDIAEGELQLIVWDKVVCWVHDGSGVGWVGQAKRVAKFMDCYSKQVETWNRNTSVIRAVWHREVQSSTEQFT